LLPRWRGAAPIQAAIRHGDTLTGISIMKMDAGLDTGPVLSQRELAIHPQETTGELTQRLADLGAALLIETLPAYLNGSLLPTPQDESRVTYAPALRKEEGLLDFTLPPSTLVNLVRALNPWPGAYTIWQGQPLKIHLASTLLDPGAVPGSHAIHGGEPAIGAQGGWLVLEVLQPAGKRAMLGREFLAGARTWLEKG
jgi:methionyl-tRNA formyltransferase